eukprot:3379846-Rhodomonas_salina.1
MRCGSLNFLHVSSIHSDYTHKDMLTADTVKHRAGTLSDSRAEYAQLGGSQRQGFQVADWASSQQH